MVMSTNFYGELVESEYTLVDRTMPIPVKEFQDHTLLAMLENAEHKLLVYTRRAEVCRAEAIRRAQEREVESIEDPDFICDILGPDTVLCRFKDGLGPWNRGARI